MTHIGGRRGILAHGAYLPHRRLDRAAIRATMGTGGGRGTRTVASYDEDTTTLGVEAARIALRGSVDPEAIWFATAEPAYLEKTNACAIHAALGLDPSVAAFDAGGALRSGVNALRASVRSRDRVLVVSAGIRTGLATSADEANGGDGAAALLVGDGNDGELLAEHLGDACVTDEVLDRWRIPTEAMAKQWEERFGEDRYPRLFERAWPRALADAGLSDDDVDTIIVTAVHPRAIAAVRRRLGADRVRDDLTSTVGNTGTAHAALLLSAALDELPAGRTLALVTLGDGVDVILFRTAPAIEQRRSTRPVTRQLTTGGELPYAKFLQWRGTLAVQPPNRPEPQRVSAPAALRHAEWKFGFVGGRGETSGLVHLPPSAVSLDDRDTAMAPVHMADAIGTVLTSTIDRLVYSPSPPVVFAVVDFDGGGRLPLELTDVDAESVRPGDRIELTFRRLSTASGIHNYFWKGRPVRGA